ncbi:hypothetical protein JVT61DRAFT_1614 [Boletus reticuloceps]|uniref:Uncharacterized protein n=1 Tax=Boletus reticuloceps TaxID=495285 RepID=A0A8I2YQJ9_9AGAM|nr:hypothetical protein JVT61DRAFT_1614 [Boletus reticuloceps]
MSSSSRAVNQWKPTSPLEELEPHTWQLWKARLIDKDIVAELCKCIDTTQYGISLTKFAEIRKQLGDAGETSACTCAGREYHGDGAASGDVWAGDAWVGQGQGGEAADDATMLTTC